MHDMSLSDENLIIDCPVLSDAAPIVVGGVGGSGVRRDVRVLVLLLLRWWLWLLLMMQLRSLLVLWLLWLWPSFMLLLWLLSLWLMLSWGVLLLKCCRGCACWCYWC